MVPNHYRNVNHAPRNAAVYSNFTGPGVSSHIAKPNRKEVPPMPFINRIPTRTDPRVMNARCPLPKANSARADFAPSKLKIIP